MYLDRGRSSWAPHASALPAPARRAASSQRLRRLKRALRRLRNSDVLIAALAAAVFAIVLLFGPQGLRAQQDVASNAGNTQPGDLGRCAQACPAAGAIQRGHRLVADADAGQARTRLHRIAAAGAGRF